MKVNNPNITAEQVWDWVWKSTVADNGGHFYAEILNKHGFVRKNIKECYNRNPAHDFFRSLNPSQLHKLFTELKTHFKPKSEALN